MTVLTDSMELYNTRIEEYREDFGLYSTAKAAADFAASLMGEGTDNLMEMTYVQKQRVHNLKYYTWVEQQGKTYEEILDQWYAKDYWTEFHGQIEEMDELIKDFNGRTGLLKEYE